MCEMLCESHILTWSHSLWDTAWQMAPRHCPPASAVSPLLPSSPRNPPSHHPTTQLVGSRATPQCHPGPFYKARTAAARDSPQGRVTRMQETCFVLLMPSQKWCPGWVGGILPARPMREPKLCSLLVPEPPGHECSPSVTPPPPRAQVGVVLPGVGEALSFAPRSLGHTHRGGVGRVP